VHDKRDFTKPIIEVIILSGTSNKNGSLYSVDMRISSANINDERQSFITKSLRAKKKKG